MMGNGSWKLVSKPVAYDRQYSSREIGTAEHACSTYDDIQFLVLSVGRLNPCWCKPGDWSWNKLDLLDY